MALALIGWPFVIVLAVVVLALIGLIGVLVVK